MVYRTFTQTFDLNTEQGSPTLLGIHTPIGGDMWRFLYPFFQAYKKFKYIGCDITIVNAARLPVDPEQLGKIDGENYIDPRDTLNPILFKGCHGESLGAVLDSMYGGLTTDIFRTTALDKQTLDSTLANFYYTALGDDAWRKSPVQKTLRIRGLHPLVYSLAMNHQLMPANSIFASQYAENTYTENATGVGVASDVPQSGAFGTSVGSAGAFPLIENTHLYDASNMTWLNKQLGSIFTNRTSRLGWLDTMQLIGNNDGNVVFDPKQITQLPKIFMGILMLPPAYLSRQYLRVLITHKIKFSGYRTITTGGNNATTNLTAGTIGYFNEYTGNVPSGGTKDVESLTRDVVDYDAIEESDEDGPDCE